MDGKEGDIMFLLHEISLSEDDTVEEHPICMREDNGEIKHMGILLKRRISQGIYIGTEYYHYVDFYGRSPINFNYSDYKELKSQGDFDMSLSMIADFGFSFTNVEAEPGLGTERKQRTLKRTTLLPVSKTSRLRSSPPTS
ncbi:hypothetical protein [Peribacillus frigoritolerans]|uniref:hypothetical protein n=1 Tax=Peribacillus frigoritolerans TaxID=450367 RepID=UPI0024178D88|nr:hypothetical protein [Peribacillus frigoritolerans]MDG4850648.1 hypothetical protein [Peribacillus frigoritolerans]